MTQRDIQLVGGPLDGTSIAVDANAAGGCFPCGIGNYTMPEADTHREPVQVWVVQDLNVRMTHAASYRGRYKTMRFVSMKRLGMTA